MKPVPLWMRLALCVPWCLLLVLIAIAAAVDEALNWATDKARAAPWRPPK